MGNDDEHQGGEAGREQEAENLPLKLDPDESTALVFQARAEGEASNSIGSQL